MTFAPKYQTLVDVFLDATKAHAHRPLFGVKRSGAWSWMTYADFAEAVTHARGGLAGLGVGRGDRVAVITDNRPEWAVGAYATYSLGASYVPMYESQLATDWEYILQDSGSKVVIVANDRIRDEVLSFQGKVDGLDHVVVLDGGGTGEHCITWAQLLTQGKTSPADLVHPEAEETCGFIYTSGTTGKPKGVKLSHRNIASNVSAMHEIFPMSPTDRSLSFLPWAHSFGHTVELHGLLSMGASMGIAESREKIVANLGEVQPTLLFAVPAIFNRIYDGLYKRMEESGGLRKTLFERAMANQERRRELALQKRSSGWADFQHRVFDRLVFSKVRERFGGKLRYAFSGGAAISKTVAEFIDSLGITVYEGYGLTETSPIATANWPGARKIGSVGKPLPGVEVEVDRAVTGDPKNGEIIVRGHNVMQGYHGLDDENDQSFTEDGGFRTGDMGYVDEEGFVYITGRIKEQYKLMNGKYVVPAPLEEKLKLSPFITNVYIDGANQPFNVALIVPEMAALESWAGDHGVSARGEDLLQHAKIREKMEEEIDRFSKDFKSYEKIRRFELLAGDFTVENGMLTPKMSLKRPAVAREYGELLDRIYRDAQRSAA
ncbi:MAG TPA: long-chain fatty acid--CoA ligase [Polyangiaceae bacterium LLY-WYZ-14_1]|nr:long-chain fatty acid--CoA ligase [Polyangiaceae bacterium LLY-WYZ-14_1]